MTPITRLITSETPTTVSMRSRSLAPRYWLHSTDVPRLITSNMMNVKVIIWLARPTAATLSSECRESMKVSTAPRVMISRVSMSMGRVSDTSSRRSGDFDRRSPENVRDSTRGNAAAAATGL